MAGRRIEALGIPLWPAVVLVSALAVGALAAGFYPYPEWHPLKRAVFGGLLGGLCGMTVTARRLLH